MKKLKKILAVALVSLSLISVAVFSAACGEQPHVHALLKVEAKQATCLEDGNIEYYACKDCDKLFTDANGKNEISATEVKTTTTAHGHLTKTEAKAATCVAAGNVAYWTCDVCGKTFSDENATKEVTLAATVTAINASAHTHLTKTDENAATCVDGGNIAYWTCDDCGKIYSNENATTEVALAATATAINASAHTHLIKTSAQAATCVSAGNSDYWTCSGCKKVYSDANGTTETTVAAMTTEINPANHSRLTKTEAKAATCVAAGNVAYWTCGGCGKIYSDENATEEITLADTVIAIDATAHGEIISHDAKEATCAEAGNSAYYSCSLCEKKYSDEQCEHEVTDVVIPVLNTHSGTIEKHEAVAATCETPGGIAHWTCTVCNKYYSDEACTDEIGDIVIPVLTVHNSVTHYGSVAATCSDEGNIEYWHCTVCNKYFSTDPAVSGAIETSLAGTATAIDPDNHVHLTGTGAKAATCIATGNTAYWTCDDCGAVFSDAAGTQPTTLEATVEAKNPDNHGTLAYTAATPADCSKDGVKEHYTCELCHKNYSDGQCENLLESIVDPQNNNHGTVEAGTLTHTSATPADCSKDGVLEHYTCEVCHKNYSDEACTNLLTSTVDPQNNNHGTLNHTERLEPKCNAVGHIEYWTCTVCHKEFSDEACTTLAGETELPTTAHHLEKTEEVPFQCTVDGTEAYWTCADCGNLFSDAEGTTQIDAPIAIPAHHVPTHYDAKDPAWGWDGCIDHWQCTACEKYFSDEDANEELTEEQVIIPRDAKPVIKAVPNPGYKDGTTIDCNKNYEYINVYYPNMIRISAAASYNFWSTDKGWDLPGKGTYPKDLVLPTVITDTDNNNERWLEFKGTAARFQLFNLRDSYTEGKEWPNTAQVAKLFGSETARRPSMDGFEFLYTFSISADGGFALVIADSGANADISSNAGYAFLFDGNTITYRMGKVIYATATLNYEDENKTFRFGYAEHEEKHEIAFGICRVNGTDLTLALYVDGFLVKFEKTANTTDLCTVVDNGTFLMDVTKGRGERILFIANRTSETEFTTLKIHDLDIRYDEHKPVEEPTPEPEEVATEAKNNYLDEAEEQNTDGND